MVNASALRPGDVVVVRTPWTLAGAMIRLGAMLHGERPVDHVAVVVDVLPSGDVELIEGRPSGVGSALLHGSGYTLVSSNAAQPKTDARRAEIVRLADAMVGTGYDWEAIAVDFLGALWLRQPHRPSWNPAKPPRHVVCSSMASWLYRAPSVGLVEPAGEDRWCTPWAWQQFNRRQEWRTVPTAGEKP